MNKKKIEKVAIVGSRGYKHLDDVETYVAVLEAVVISGGAIGVDSTAEKTALRPDVDLDTMIFLPEYRKWGGLAPLKRNYQIVDAADRVVAFWDGTSSGTVHTINYTLKKRKPLLVFRRDEIGKLFVSTDMKIWTESRAV